MTPTNPGAILRTAAAFLLGAILGGALLTPFTGREVGHLRLLLRQRQLELLECGTEVGNLKAELTQSLRARGLLPTIRSTRVSVLGVDPVTQFLIAEAAERLLTPILGRALDRVDAHLIQALLDRRLIQAGDRLYRVRVRYAVVAPETHLELVATPVEP